MAARSTATVLRGHEVVLSHPDKILFPEEGITKRELASYYHDVAEYMLPHVKDHPLMLQRFPNGIQRSGFIQQEAPAYFPPWIARASVPAPEGERHTHALANNAETLVYLANQDVITLHMWQSRADKPDFPDRLVFDLDPSSEADFPRACATAKTLRRLLERFRLPSFVMTTGSRGLHVTVPLDRSENFEAVREFARRLGERMAAELPEYLTVEQRVAQRGRRLFLDAMRNTYGHTAVAPYSVRAHDGAPVAAPIAWEELDDCTLGSRRYTLRNILSRLKKRGDPWKTLRRQATSLKEARKRV